MSKLKNILSLRKASGLMVLLFTAIGILSIACMDKKTYAGLPGYDLSQPTKYNMPDGLLEISGITFRNDKSDSVYAEQDEDGRVYYFKLGDKQIKYSTFGKSGDYEDIAILGDEMILLRSDGTLFTFPFKSVRNGDIADVQKQKDLLPPGEYEGMYADNKTGQLYILCKHCSDDRTSKSSSGYIFKASAGGALKQSGQFSINVKEIEAMVGQKKVSFHPSAFTKRQASNEWYILSSVNKLIVVTDAAFKVKGVYPISPSLFLQPEGIAFDAQNNLYISNEGDKITPGNILKFNYKK
jgi:hypothetical protein